jgi:hypothetical protein
VLFGVRGNGHLTSGADITRRSTPRAMTDTGLRKILAECLSREILNRGGQILYSGIDTLRPGSFYFVGFNPAADGTNGLLQEMRLHDKNWSAYTRQCWMCKGKCDPEACPHTGEAKHQKNVQRIMCELGLKPEEALATNLVFVESSGIIKADPHFETYLQ